MELLFPILGLVAGLLTTLTQSKTNWCAVQEKYCSGKEHVGCEPNSFPHNPECRNITLVPMDSRTKHLIVTLHNSLRNEIAGGRIEGFPQAMQMRQMRWDDKLEELAQAHVMHCEFKHDQCRATPEYPFSGQNIFYQASIGYETDPREAIDRGIRAWFDEWKETKPSVIEKLTQDQSKVFHFTVMANDQNNYLGCAMIKYLTPENGEMMDGFLLTCNYQFTNVLGQKVYEKGKSCSGCPRGCGPIFKDLCRD